MHTSRSPYPQIGSGSTIPSSRRPSHGGIHSCGHPLRHALSRALLLGGWLIANATLSTSALYALSGLLMPGPLRPLAFFGGLLAWWVLGVPFGVGFLTTWSRGRCTAHAPTPAHIERIILSPDAAYQMYGVQGQITLERQVS